MATESIKIPESLEMFKKSELKVRESNYYGFKLGMYKYGNFETSEELFVIDILDPKNKIAVDSSPIFELIKENLPDGNITFEQLKEAAETAITVLPHPEEVKISLVADPDILRIALRCFRTDDWAPAVEANKVREIASRTMGYGGSPITVLLGELGKKASKEVL